MLQIGAFDVFYFFLDNTLSIAVFTLIKLMFETQAAKLWQQGVMGRRKNVSGPFLTHGRSFFILWYIMRRTKEARGNEIHLTKPLKSDQF